MPSLFNLSLGKRLYVLAGIVTLALASLAVTAHLKMSDVVNVAKRTEQARVPQLNQIGDMELTVTRVSLQLRHAMLARNPAELEATLQNITALRQTLKDLQDRYERGLFTDAGKQRYAALPLRWPSSGDRVRPTSHSSMLAARMRRSHFWWNEPSRPATPCSRC